jgi:hypothetical protein
MSESRHAVLISLSLEHTLARARTKKELWKLNLCVAMQLKKGEEKNVEIFLSLKRDVD